ncbi:MAG: PspA/IM30 family protein, partial [Okeania sp. SIO2D1]|nr:PspA/IM30 family protein [Okeania sp. SIO2D1]
MGLLDRVWRVIRANINTLISGAEDPEKVLEQTVTDMQ